MDDMLQNKQKFYTLSGGLLAVALLLIVVTTILSGSQKNSQNLSKSNTSPEQSTNDQPHTTLPDKSSVPPLAFPKVTVSQWVDTNSPLQTSSSARIYSFKQVGSLDTIKTLSQTLLGQAQSQIKNNQLISLASSTPQVDDLSIFVADLRTGEFSYASKKGITLPRAVGQTPVSEKTQVDAFIKTFALDPTLEISGTYKKRSKENVVFYEVHRNWTQAGLPILNAFGILNISQNQPLAGLTLGTGSDRPTSADIYATSDGTDGLVRENDFNTMTIGVNSATQKVVSISSNIRPIENAKLKTVSLISYSEAVGKLKENKYESLYTSPAGSGTPTFDKVYPGNSARTTQAQVKDAVVAYLEQPPAVTQTQLSPYYLFRGTAYLDSGYEVNFIATVPAEKENKPQASVQKSKFSFEFIKSVLAQAITNTPISPGQNCQGGQCQGTFEVTPQPTVPVTPTIPITIAPTTPSQTPSNCIPNISNLINIRQVAPNLNVGQITKQGINQIKFDNAAVGDWYSYSTSGKTLTADDLLTAIEAVPAEGRNIHRLEIQPIIDKQLGQGGPGCPVRITGKSPSIFVYGPAGTSFTIQTAANQTYANPKNSENIWHVSIGYNGRLISNGIAEDYLYYEHENVAFDKPAQGWIVKKTELPMFAAKLASQFKFNLNESSRLTFELNHAASSVNSDALFIGQILQSEVDKKLPLVVQGTSNVVRIHFYVGKAEVNEMNSSPSVTPVKRTAFQVVELGASAE